MLISRGDFGAYKLFLNFFFVNIKKYVFFLTTKTYRNPVKT